MADFVTSPVPSYMFWAGDGHHWHVNDLVTTELDRADNGVKVGTGAPSRASV